jgi:FlaA1/EpsC-like NDP-sugar epimerase
MTITEASQLVIQAGAMSEGCEVFVLDMGQSIKIKDLIYNMIKLSGLTVKDTKNSEGDIEVKIIGLRPGEKLYEELLLGDNPQKTYHEKIQKAQDPYIPFEKLKIELDILSTLLEDSKANKVKDLVVKLLPSYKSNSKIVDHIYQEKLNHKDNIESISIAKNNDNKVISIKAK